MSYGYVGMRGFGVGVEGELVDEYATGPAPEPDISQAINDVHRIAQKYDGPPVENITPINIAPGGSTKVDFSQTPFNSIVFTVTQGTLSAFFGDYQTQPNAVPHLTVIGGGPTVQYMFSTNGRIITLTNPTTALQNVLGTMMIERL